MPNIDRIARGGAPRFKPLLPNGPECTPTRAALITCRYPQRVGGLECAIGIGDVGPLRRRQIPPRGAAPDLGLPVAETSISADPEAGGLRDPGLAGTRHLGYEPKFLPRRHGFDDFFGPLGGAVDYYTHVEPMGTTRCSSATTSASMSRGPPDGPASPPRLSRFIPPPQGRPLLPLRRLHRAARPLPGPRRPKGKTTTRATYAAMVQRLDHGVARFSQRPGSKTWRRTPWSSSPATTAARGWGGTSRSTRGAMTFEGGIRVPCLVRWPVFLTRGSRWTRSGRRWTWPRPLPGLGA